MLATLAPSAHITRATRKEINPALHRAGLPTLGACDTLAEYRKGLTKAQRTTLAGLMGAPAPTGFVKAKIRARKEALAELHALSDPAGECANCREAALVA